MRCPHCGQEIAINDRAAPSVEEVAEYAASINADIDAEEFVAYYEARGWQVNGRKIKSWRACVRTWKIRAAKPKNNAQKQIDRNVAIAKEWLNQ
jgi:hypothetical protein